MKAFWSRISRDIDSLMSTENTKVNISVTTYRDSRKCNVITFVNVGAEKIVDPAARCRVEELDGRRHHLPNDRVVQCRGRSNSGARNGQTAHHGRQQDETDASCVDPVVEPEVRVVLQVVRRLVLVLENERPARLDISLLSTSLGNNTPLPAWTQTASHQLLKVLLPMFRKNVNTPRPMAQ